MGDAMASLSKLMREGRAGFLPDWIGHTGRAYCWRAKARTDNGSLKSWDIGDWFYRPDDCDYFRSLVSVRDWREHVSSGLPEDSTEVSVEIVSKEFESGQPRGRLSALRGTTYPVVKRKGRPVIQWAKGEQYGKTDGLPAPDETDIFNARVSKGIGWYVFAWEDGNSNAEGHWVHVASFARKDHLDDFIAQMEGRGEKVQVVDKPGV